MISLNYYFLFLSGKNKHNPNSSENTDRAKGGQPGHKKHTLEKSDKDEITDEVDHVLDEDNEISA